MSERESLSVVFRRTPRGTRHEAVEKKRTRETRRRVTRKPYICLRFILRCPILIPISFSYLNMRFFYLYNIYDRESRAFGQSCMLCLRFFRRVFSSTVPHCREEPLVFHERTKVTKCTNKQNYTTNLNVFDRIIWTLEKYTFVGE